jgi:RNA polymerase sigma-70 factor (ECF subfamily)
MALSQTDFLAEFLKIERDLRAMIAAMVPDASFRDDVFQETSIVIWKKFQQYDPEKPFKAWARGIASFEVLKYRSKLSKMPLAFSEEALIAIVDAYSESEEFEAPKVEALKNCIAQLPEKSNAIIKYHYENKLKAEEIASLLKLSLDNIYQTLSRVRKKLKQCVQLRLSETQVIS